MPFVPINTFVFLDLETSGLYGKLARITEFAAQSVSRYDFEQMYSRKLPVASSNKSTPKTQSNILEVIISEGPSNSLAECDTLEADALDECAKNNCKSVKRRLFDDASEKTGLVLESCANKISCTPHPKRRARRKIYELPEVPRSVTAIQQLFRVPALIFPDVENITGLNNAMLEKYPLFDSRFCDQFRTYLRLPKPICLIAHNGFMHDFPLIISEFMQATMCQYEWDDIQCADSLVILKILDKIEVTDEVYSIRASVNECLEFFDDDNVFDSEVEMDVDSFKNGDSDVSKDAQEISSSNGYTNEKLCSVPVTPPRSGFLDISNGERRCAKTPVLPSTSSMNRGCPDTPQTPSHNFKLSPPDSNSCIQLGSVVGTPPATPVRFGVSSRPTHILNYAMGCKFEEKVKCAHQNSDYNCGLNPSEKPFAQANIYERLFGRKFLAHQARDDAEALFRIAGHYGPLFAQAADVVKIPMAEIKPKWITNRILNCLKNRN